MNPVLQFRRVSHDDIDVVDEWFDDADVRQFIGERGWTGEVLHVANREQLEEGTVHREFDVAIMDGAAAALVDIEVYVDGWASLACVVDPRRRRQSVARGCLQFAFEVARAHGATRMVAFVEPDNTPSIGLLESVGFLRRPLSSHNGHSSWSMDLA